MERLEAEKERPVKTGSEKVLFPYRTISIAQNSDSLLAYELRYESSNYGRYTEYEAVIRNINPAKDDYKMYCKEVIRDIKKTTGKERIGVSIYDSYEAFYLNHSELKKKRFIDTSEAKFIAQHTVATYHGDIDYSGDCNCSLIYYPDAANGHYKKESFILN